MISSLLGKPEVIPPVPAPRFKKKKKKMSLPDNVSIVVEEMKNTTLEDIRIIPPPRLKHKSGLKTSAEIKNLNQIEVVQEVKEEVLVEIDDISKEEPTTAATIVDILYKPNHNDVICSASQQCTFLKESSFQLPVTEGLDHLVKYKSSFTDNNIVPKVSSSKRNKFKDTEEDDSGVYFSDTKSSPENVKPLWRNFDHEKYKLETPGISITSKCLRNSDSPDNNQTKNLGPHSFTDNKFGQILDNFEAQTVSAFREDILNRFEVCEHFYEQHHTVKNWLDVGVQKSVTGNGLSEYLKCMLQTDDLDDTSSYQCLSAVEEENRPDSNIGSKVAEKTVKTINVFSDINNLDTTSLGDSENVDLIVESNDVFVNNLFVNNDVYNSQCLEHSNIIVENDKDIFVCNESKTFELESEMFSDFNENVSPVVDSMDLSEEINVKKALKSPVVELGNVKNLINIFENIHYIETPLNHPYLFDEVADYILPPPNSFSDNFDQTNFYENSLESIQIENECEEVNPFVYNDELITQIEEDLSTLKELLSPAKNLNFQNEVNTSTRIPIVVLTQVNHSEESHVKQAVGTVELHCEDNFIVEFEDESTDFSDKAVFDSGVNSNNLNNCEAYQQYEVVLEKVWNSLGIQIKEGEEADDEDVSDNDSIIISDILPGGAADASGLIMKGVPCKQNRFGSSGL